MTILQKNWERISGIVKEMPRTLREKSRIHLLFDGHFTPRTGERLARMFPLHLDLELTWVSPGRLAVKGTCDIESHLESASAEGVLHVLTPHGEPVLRLQIPGTAGTSTLTVARLGRDFWTTRQVEGTLEGPLSGDVTLSLPTEQFLRIFDFNR